MFSRSYEMFFITSLPAYGIEIRVNGALEIQPDHRSPEMIHLKRVFDSEYHGTGITWPQVRRRLHSSAAPIKVIEINSKSTGTLDYADASKMGLNAIAVGGFSLIRGLTLEGLDVTISFETPSCTTL